MNSRRNKTFAAITFAFLLTFTALLAAAPAAYAQTPTRKTTAFLSVNPPLIGLTQPLLVNLWVYPAPATLHFNWLAKAFKNIEVTFTKPDGSTDTFMPVDGSGGLGPGETEMIGAIWFHYYPDQTGTWSVQFSMPGQTLGEGTEAVYYEAAISSVTTFQVQSALVQIGLPPVDLPTDYWERPINTDNREWSQISGDWMGGPFGTLPSILNAYSPSVDSAHILWERQASAAGIIGGAYGSLSYVGGGGSVSIIMNGRAYHSIPGGMFRCVDIRTGETIFEAPGSVSYGEIYRAELRQAGTVQTQAAALSAYLWSLSSAGWKRYDAYTGALLQTITNVPRGNPGKTLGLGGQYGSLSVSFIGRNEVYALLQSGWNTTIPFALAKNEMYKWDYSKVTGNNWTTGIVWNVTLPAGAPGNGGRGSAIWVDGDIGIVNCPGEDQFIAFDLTTGDVLYWKTFDFVNMGRAYGDGKYFAFDSTTLRYHAFDFKTGNELWVSDVVGKYPWGVNQYPRGVVYDRLYVGSYDGGMYALDVDTGKIDWTFYLPTTTETPFGTWAMYLGARFAGGKIYMGTSEHTATQPYLRGNRLYCLDAFTGEHIWNVSGAISPGPIAEGYLMTTSESDGTQRCFGKGKTETTVMASPKVASKGANVLIEGTVMDMSPAQAGTPAVSDEDMTAWMDYLHMQKPMPMDITGVQVILTATAPDGSMTNLGTTTGDGYGNFFFAWTPPNAGIYKIQATFTGSNSYWSSTAETAVSVTAGPSAQPAFRSLSGLAETQAATIDMTLVVAAVAAVAVIAVAVLVLRRRK